MIEDDEDDEFLNDGENGAGNGPNLDDRVNREDPCDGGRIPITHCPVCDGAVDDVASRLPVLPPVSRDDADIQALVEKMAQRAEIRESSLPTDEAARAIVARVMWRVHVAAMLGVAMKGVTDTELRDMLAARLGLEHGEGDELWRPRDQQRASESTENTLQPAETVHGPTGPCTGQPAEAIKSAQLLTLARGLVSDLVKHPIVGPYITAVRLSLNTNLDDQAFDIRAAPRAAPFRAPEGWIDVGDLQEGEAVQIDVGPPQDAEGRAIEDEVHRRLFGEDPDRKDRP